MFTAPLLHANLLHIFMNSLALFFIGQSLERIVGWKWLLGLFTVSALGGEVASILFLPPNIVGVGASGGVIGVIAATFVLATRLPRQLRLEMHIRTLQWIIPALIPIFASKGSNVNYFAHAGGALVGFLLGYLLLKLWPRQATIPPWANASAAVALMFFAVALYAIWPISEYYNQ
jgi:rhomboid protease GluP